MPLHFPHAGKKIIVHRTDRYRIEVMIQTKLDLQTLLTATNRRGGGGAGGGAKLGYVA